jgi:hypothetical protein
MGIPVQRGKYNRGQDRDVTAWLKLSGEEGEIPKAALVTTSWLAEVILAECRLRMGET